MARHSRYDILFEPVKIGPVTEGTVFFRSHIVTEWAEAFLLQWQRCGAQKQREDGQ